MTAGMTLFIFTFGGALLLAIAIGVIMMRLVFRRRGIIMRSLNMSLLLVRMPPVRLEPTAQGTAQIRERIALMEQLYTNFHEIRDSLLRNLLYGPPAFALELTVPHVGEELSFYVAVPRRMTSAAEKVIQGIFPDAHVEPTQDYNIFNPEGAHAGGYMRLRANRYYPARSYQKLEGDPMREITNAFTKLSREGEGAALQIIARPARKKWRRKLRQHAKMLFEGKQPREGIIRAIEIASETVNPTLASSPEGQKQKAQGEKRLTPLQEEVVRALEGKAAKALFETNIRVVASAPTRERAEGIVQGIRLAFAQFSDPSINSFYYDSAAGGAAWKSFAFDFSFRAFRENKTAVLSTEELTSLFHFPNVPIDTPHVRILKAREAAPPPDLSAEGLLLGYNLFRGERRDIRMLDEDRRRHLYVIGQTGTGKTTFIENLAVQDIQAGKGVCFIDPHGDTVERMLGLVPRHRIQDVIYFNPGDIERPMGLNMLEYDPMFPEQKTFIVNELLGIFDKLYNMSIAGGPIFEQYFRNATLLVMEDPSSGNTLLEIERVLTDKAFRDLKLSHSRNIVVNNFWTQIAEKAGGEASLKDMVPYIASKFDNFIANEIMRPIVAQEKSAFGLREVMDSGKILLVNLSKGRLGDLNSSLIGLIIVGKLLMASLSRTDMAEERRKDFYLYIDEFQNVTTDSIATILSEARKYRLDLTIAHQFIGQLKEEIKKAVFGNVGSIASFRIGSEDAEFLAKQFKPVFTEQDLLNVDNYNCYLKLLINGATAPAFSMKTYAPEKGDAEIIDVIKEISRTKYGRPREEVEAEIVDRHKKPAASAGSAPSV